MGLFSESEMQDDTVKLEDNTVESSADAGYAEMKQALVEHLIGQRVTAIEWEMSKTIQLDGTRAMQVVVKLDNNLTYVMRIAGLLQQVSDAIGALDESDPHYVR